MGEKKENISEVFSKLLFEDGIYTRILNEKGTWMIHLVRVACGKTEENDYIYQSLSEISLIPNTSSTQLILKFWFLIKLKIQSEFSYYCLLLTKFKISWLTNYYQENDLVERNLISSFLKGATFPNQHFQKIWKIAVRAHMYDD